jgi:DNA-damage-inducible protein D
MNKTLQSENNSSIFEEIKQIDENGQEYWSARELHPLLEYSSWQKFLNVIQKAVEACLNSSNKEEDHFAQAVKMVDLGSGSQREIEDYHLSRYACYLIIQNADPSKPIVALGQTYFAVQTRKQELQEQEYYKQLKTEEEKRFYLRTELSEHNKNLASAAKEAGVESPFEYAIFQNHGYKGLYGGLDAKGIHKKKGLKKSQQILDHMGSTELAANLFRATQTEDKLKRDETKTKVQANQTHFEVGKKVRQTIEELGGTMPENLPTEESIKKIEKKQQKELDEKKRDKN